jgi:hypothetical protein
MSRVLIVGDSQSGAPGSVAQRKLQTLGHIVQKVENDGRGPYDYVRMPDLWAQYTGAIAAFHPDIILLIFGHNDAPNQNLRDALVRMKQNVRPKVVLSGPPQYADPTAQAHGAQVKAIYSSVFGSDFLDAYPFTSTTLPHAAPTAAFPINPHFTLAGAEPWGTAMADEVHRRLSNPLRSGRA